MDGMHATYNTINNALKRKSSFSLKCNFIFDQATPPRAASLTFSDHQSKVASFQTFIRNSRLSIFTNHDGRLHQTQTATKHPPLRRNQGHLHRRSHLLLRPQNHVAHPPKPLTHSPQRIPLPPHWRQRLRQIHPPPPHLRPSFGQTRELHPSPRPQLLSRHTTQFPPCLSRDRLGHEDRGLCGLRRAPHGGYSRHANDGEGAEFLSRTKR